MPYVLYTLEDNREGQKWTKRSEFTYVTKEAAERQAREFRSGAGGTPTDIRYVEDVAKAPQEQILRIGPPAERGRDIQRRRERRELAEQAQEKLQRKQTISQAERDALQRLTRENIPSTSEINRLVRESRGEITATPEGLEQMKREEAKKRVARLTEKIRKRAIPTQIKRPLPLDFIGIPYKMDLDAPAAAPDYSRYGQNLVMEAAPSEDFMDWRKKAEEEAFTTEDLFGKIEERISFGGYIPPTKQMQLKMGIEYGSMIADKPSTSFITDPKGWVKYGHGVFMGEALPAAVETAPYAAGFGFLTMAAPTAALVVGLAALPFYTQHLQEEIAEKGILRTSIIETPSLALYAGASKIGGELSKTSKFNVEAMFKRWRFERKIKMPVGEEWRGRSTFEPTGEMQFLAKRGAGVTYITKEIKPQGYKLNGETQLLIKPKKPPEFPELLETYLFLKEFAKLPEEKVRAMAILDKKASKDMAFQEMIREQPAPITEKGKAKMEFIEEQPLIKGIKKAKETKEQKYWKDIFRGKRGQAGLVFDIGGLIPPQIIKPSKYIDMPKSFRRAKPPKEDFIIRGKTEPSRDAFGLFPPILISKTDQLYKTQLTGQQPSPLDDLFKPKEDQDRKGKIIDPEIIEEAIREQEKEKQKGRYTIFPFLDDPPLPPIDPETPPVFVEPHPETPLKFRGWMPKKDKRTTEPFDQGFNVFARERGRFVRVNKKPLLRQRAKNLGAEVVDNTSAASFVLRKTKREPANNLDDVLFFKRTKFRSPKTKSKLPPKTFIEKNNFRIDTAGERRGISARGWVANRRRAERRRAEGGLLMNFGGFGL